MKPNGQHSSAMRMERISLFVPVAPNGEPHAVHMQKVRKDIQTALERANLNHQQTTVDGGSGKSSIRALIVSCVSQKVAEQARAAIAGLSYLPKEQEGIMILM